MDGLCFRLSGEGDLPGLLRLWEGAGWGRLEPRQWREWFVDGPQGPSLIAVAVDPGGEIAALEVFAPARLSVAGREVRALRCSAPILRPDLRGQSLRRAAHPAFGLYRTAAAVAAEHGFEVGYSLPDHAWLSILRNAHRVGMPRFAIAAFGCAELPLAPASEPALERFARGVLAQPVASFGAEHEALWHAARESFPIACGVVRDAAWLSFRNSGHIALEVRDREDGSLVGYSATKRQTGLLADLLARRPAELTAVVAATARWLAGERRPGEPGDLTHLKAMRTPALDPTLAALGFAPVDYRFGFICNTYGDAAADASWRARLAPERWYLMPGD